MAGDGWRTRFLRGADTTAYVVKARRKEKAFAGTRVYMQGEFEDSWNEYRIW